MASAQVPEHSMAAFGQWLSNPGQDETHMGQFLFLDRTADLTVRDW